MEAQPRPVQFAHEAAGTENVSYEAFFAAEWARVVSAVMLLTGSKQEAEDIAQGAFLRLLERWDTLDHEADVGGTYSGQR